MGKGTSAMLRHTPQNHESFQSFATDCTDSDAEEQWVGIGILSPALRPQLVAPLPPGMLPGKASKPKIARWIGHTNDHVNDVQNKTEKSKSKSKLVRTGLAAFRESWLEAIAIAQDADAQKPQVRDNVLLRAHLGRARARARARA